MKKNIITIAAMLCTSAILASCGNTPKKENKDKFKDSRLDLFTVVSGEMDGAEFVPDGKTYDFKSLYEAANYVYENCENGSFVKAKDDSTDTIIFQKRSSVDSIRGDNIYDQWFYYNMGNNGVLDGYTQYVAGYVDTNIGEKYNRLYVTTDCLKQSYQPYYLLRHETLKTASWNLLPLLDTSIRYNPHAFTGMREITYKFDLTQSKIRPSYSKDQKVEPLITLSQTDSYNWSNQGIYMDTDTGNWYYLKGETQSDSKILDYDNKEVILTSTWDKEKQEYTPDGDVKMTLTYVFDETEEVWTNDLAIEVTYKDGTTKSFKKNYDYTNINGRGTPRANISLDLVAGNDKVEEGSYAPDFMCGAYFKNIVVSEAKGSVPEGLTDEEYGGDSEMCCKPGETYNLLAGAEKNDADCEIILDNYGLINYHNDVKDKDIYDISYEQIAPTTLRTKEVLDVEQEIAKIKDTDTKDSAIVIKTLPKFNALSAVQQKLITRIDGYTQLEKAIER